MPDVDSLNAVQTSPCDQVLFSVRIPRRMKDQIQRTAKECGCSCNYVVKEAIKRMLAERWLSISERRPPEV